MKKRTRIILTLVVVVLCVLSVAETFLFYRRNVQIAKEKAAIIAQEKERQEKITEEILEAAEKEQEEQIPDIPERKIVVCIDPGHYGGVNRFDFSDGSSYCEGDTTLLIALELQKILEQEYGIESYLTRDSSDITIQGLSNAVLENGYISLRGEAAAGSDLFVSLHTNANNDMANGYDTLMQPVSLNKPFVFLNTAARNSEEAVRTANLIGSHIVEIYAEKNLASITYFQEVTDGNNLMEWTDIYNDTLDVPGTVCCRTGDDGDYYGVL